MSWVTPIARGLNSIEQQWAEHRSKVLFAGIGLALVAVLLAGSYVYFVTVVKPRKIRENEAFRQQQITLSRMMENTRRNTQAFAAEWRECQKHHPEMKPGMECPEGLSAYSYAAPQQ